MEIVMEIFNGNSNIFNEMDQAIYILMFCINEN